MITALPHLDLRQLSILVVHPRDRDGDLLLRQLQRAGCRVQLAWPPDETPSQTIDALFCLIDRRTQVLMSLLSERSALAVIGVADMADSAVLSLIDKATPHAVLMKPLATGEILTNLIVACNNSRYQSRLLTKIAKLEGTLRAFRRVERAKAILMEMRKIGESEAYAYLRDLAMRRRVPIGVVAGLVIDSSEVLSSEPT
jgi:AmiR/NasT family two-component response regulator